MKKLISILGGLILTFALVGTVSAVVNAVTPSTNDINRTNGWAYVDQISQGVGTTDLKFTSTRGFWSCFEYRTDGDTSQVIAENNGVNFNTNITDGLYRYFCERNGNETATIQANEYVEVRMVFGAETDERFDWTRFDVLPAPFVRSAVITSPLAGTEVSGTVSFAATLTDKDGDDNVQWAVRKGTCAAATGTVFGNVDGFSDSYTWDGKDFHALADTTNWISGGYCFVFNPTESLGDAAIRETREFLLKDQTPPTTPEILGFKNPDLGCGVITNSHTTTVDWTESTDDSGIAGYEYYVDYPLPDGIGRGVWNPSSLWTTTENYGSLNEGTHHIKVRAKDNAGNYSSWSNICDITADWTSPNLTFLGFRNQSSATYDSVPIINSCGSVNTTGFIAWEWLLNNVETNPVNYHYEIIGGPYTGFSADIDVTHYNGQIPVTGTYIVQVAGTDVAGNVGTPQTCSVTYQLPIVDLCSNLEGDQAVIPNGYQINPDGTCTLIKVGPPTVINQCKYNGWRMFNNPSFKNQGQCVSFVVSHQWWNYNRWNHNFQQFSFFRLFAKH
jgi:hypothetical protein